MLFNLNDKQIIVYGAPGTGKSYAIQENLDSLGFNTDEDVLRVVFHHDYTYADFIGYISPNQTSSNIIDYKFLPGPFTLALEKALSSSKKICLLIEELNRGNSSAIFGDIFQLLDRDSDNNSMYSITNQSIREYLNKNQFANNILKSFDIGLDDIILPSNLYIIGTMNTADQNVFTIDTAFKRRFKMRYMPINFDESNPKLMRLNQLSYLNIFDQHNTWSDFAKFINLAIDNINKDIISIPEDKKIGPFFVDELDVSCKQSFCDKVIYYLKNDVFKYSELYLKDSFEKIYEDFVINEKDIFAILENNGG